MKKLIGIAQNLLIVIDAYLDYFWVAIVLYTFHRKMSEMYWKRAASVQDHSVYVLLTVPRKRLKKLHHQARRHALEAQLIKEMFV